MAPFDPYHKWLGIPPDQQPVSHYRLLGIEDFESDADAIEGAAEQRTIYLRTFQTGPSSELAERLLNEISAARVCLLDRKSRARYDTQLRAAITSADVSRYRMSKDLGIVCSVWLNPGAATDENLDHKALFEIHRKAMAQAIHKAMSNEPSIDWLLENQDKITHKYYQRGLDGEL